MRKIRALSLTPGVADHLAVAQRSARIVCAVDTQIDRVNERMVWWGRR